MDLKAKRDQLQATQQELVGQINHIRGQLSVIEELIAEETQAEEMPVLLGIDRSKQEWWNARPSDYLAPEGDAA